jgi:hypothetical protein
MFVLNLVLNALVEEIDFQMCYLEYCIKMVRNSYERSQPVYNPDWMFEDEQG